MVVLDSLRRTPSVLGTYPVLFAFVLLYGAVSALGQLPQLVFPSQNPFVAMALSWGVSGIFLFVFPFFQGGLIGVTNDAVAGDRPTLGRFLGHGKSNYLSMLGAYVVVGAIAVVFGVAFVIAVFVATLGAVALDGIAGVAVAAVVVLLLGVVALAVFVALGFYGHAVVIDGERAIDSLGRSVDVVRSNLRAVAGYTLVSVVGGGLVGALYVGLSLALFSPPSTPDTAAPAAGIPAASPDPALALGFVGGSTVVTSVFGAVFLVFSVAFYRAVTGLDRPAGAAGGL